MYGLKTETCRFSKKCLVSCTVKERKHILSEYRLSTVSIVSKYGLDWSAVWFGLVPSTLTLSSQMKAHPRATRKTVPGQHPNIVRTTSAFSQRGRLSGRLKSWGGGGFPFKLFRHYSKGWFASPCARCDGIAFRSLIKMWFANLPANKPHLRLTCGEITPPPPKILPAAFFCLWN